MGLYFVLFFIAWWCEISRGRVTLCTHLLTTIQPICVFHCMSLFIDNIRVTLLFLGSSSGYKSHIVRFLMITEDVDFQLQHNRVYRWTQSLVTTRICTYNSWQILKKANKPTIIFKNLQKKSNFNDLTPTNHSAVYRLTTLDAPPPPPAPPMAGSFVVLALPTVDAGSCWLCTTILAVCGRFPSTSPRS